MEKIKKLKIITKSSRNTKIENTVKAKKNKNG